MLDCGNRLWIDVWKILAHSVRRVTAAVVGAMVRPAIVRPLGGIRPGAAQRLDALGPPVTPSSGTMLISGAWLSSLEALMPWVAISPPVP